MTIADKVVPSFVGVDIGCGMYTVNLGKQPLDLEKIDEAVHSIPSGFSVWPSPAEAFDLERLACFSQLKKPNYLACSLGSLGGSNHFIEIDRRSDGTGYLIIHSGSCNLGKQVAEIYIQAAADEERGISNFETVYRETIENLKAQGRFQDIQPAIETLRRQRERRIETDPALCALSGINLENYLHDIEICQEFARRNRELMAEIILQKTGLTAGESFHTIHNYIDRSEMILRKGAIAAPAGRKILIPLNMKDGSILALGKDNPEWNNSAPHGAGRLMSRRQARDAISLSDFQKSMEGIYTTSVETATIDEAPMAYKPPEEILSLIEETAEILEVIKPVYNFKAGEESPGRK